MKTEELPVIQLRGTPYERGRIHGDRLREPIRALHELMRSQLGVFIPGSQSASAVKQFFADLVSETRFIDDIERWAPELLEEVRGIADAAGLPMEHVLELNLLDEIWARLVRLNALSASKGCSSFGVVGTPGLPTWSGQNMDVPPWLEGFQVLLEVHQTERQRAYLYAYAGSLGINGVNSAGLGVSCNTLAMLRSASSGLPVLFVLRRLLEHSDLAAALAFLTRVPHASGQNYLLAVQGVVRSLECSAGGVAEYSPDPAHGRVCHTNHPLASADLDPHVKVPADPSTHARLASINARLGEPGKTVALDDVKRALAARDDPAFPVCCTGRAAERGLSYTLGSSIYELGPAPKLHQAAGPPCTTHWKTFELTP